MPHPLFDARLATKLRRIFRIDTCVVTRSPSTVDAEGDAIGGRATVVSVTRGTLYSVSSSEEELAAQRGTKVSKAFALELGSDVLAGDWITVGGVTYEVVEMVTHRIKLRALLRVVVP